MNQVIRDGIIQGFGGLVLGSALNFLFTKVETDTSNNFQLFGEIGLQLLGNIVASGTYLDWLKRRGYRGDESGKIIFTIALLGSQPSFLSKLANGSKTLQEMLQKTMEPPIQSTTEEHPELSRKPPPSMIKSNLPLYLSEETSF